MNLAGKVVLITGASEGIGAACVHSFRKRGAKIAIVARSEAKLRAVGGEDAVVTAGDLTNPAVRERCVAATLERFGSIDVLVNNAGIGMYQQSWLAPDEDVRRLMELNFIVPMAMVRLVAPRMVAQHSGMIVNVGSIAGKLALPWMSVYSASKYAVGAWTNGLRLELKSSGVRTMTVCPGYVQTRFQSHMLGGTVPSAIQRAKKQAITAGQCAEAIVRGVEAGKKTVMTPPIGWLLIGLARLFPSLVDWQLHRLYCSAGEGSDPPAGGEI